MSKTNEEREGILESVPYRTLSPVEDDVDLVVEGTPEAATLEEEEEKKAPPESKDDLKAQLEALKAKLETNEQVAQVVKQALERQPQVQAPVFYPQKEPEDPAERKAKINNKWLEDPSGAFEEQVKEQLRPVVDLLFQQTATLSKELALKDEELKPIYEKYQDEVEKEVAQMSPIDRAQDPRVYHRAIEKVKAKHSEEIFSEKLEVAVEAKLKELGLDPEKLKKPATFSPAGEQRVSQAPSTAKKTVVVPKWVVDEADKIGLDPKFYYQHLKEKGVLK